MQQTLSTEDHELINSLPDDAPAALIEAVLAQDPYIYLYYDKATVFRAMFAYEEAIRARYNPIRAESILSRNAVLTAFRRTLETLP